MEAAVIGQLNKNGISVNRFFCSFQAKLSINLELFVIQISMQKINSFQL